MNPCMSYLWMPQIETRTDSVFHIKMIKLLTSNTSYFIVCEASHTIKYDVFT